MCDALRACQKKEIIHRDIKPANIFVVVSEDGTVENFKLGDFGVARVVEKKDKDLSKKGTPTYMAPEVCKMQPYGKTVDIYSLGIVLYQLLNHGRGPFFPSYPKDVSLGDIDNALQTRISGEKEFPAPSVSVSEDLLKIIYKACAYKAEERYDRPVKMKVQLNSILEKEDDLNTNVKIYDDGTMPLIPDSDTDDDTDDRKPVKYVNWFHLATLFCFLCVTTFIGMELCPKEFVMIGIGFLVWFFELVSFMPAIAYGYSYFCHQSMSDGIITKESKQFKRCLGATLLLSQLLFVWSGFFLYNAQAEVFYVSLYVMSAIVCLPLTTYGYKCYWKGEKNKKQTNAMYLMDKVGSSIHAILIGSLSILLFFMYACSCFMD